MNEEDLEFERQLAELAKMVEPLPPPPSEYRLYYDTPTGNPFAFSMEHHPGSAYILVTKEDYETANIEEIKVINGRLMYKKIDSFNKIKYGPGKGVATVKDDIQFVVDDEYDGETSTWKLND
jgi:uncharacterized protein YaiE (UPF0345 family)